MINKFKKAMRGFTLIELLVVIAIIGLLASIVLVSLSNARRKARDSRRVGDLRSIQLALELYFDANQEYPFALTVAAGGGVYTLTQAEDAFRAVLGLSTNLVPLYVGGMPTDPSNSIPGLLAYGYVPGNQTATPLTRNCDNTATNDVCLHYLLVAGIEEQTNPSLRNDNDQLRGGFAALNGYACERPEGAADPGPYFYCIGA